MLYRLSVVWNNKVWISEILQHLNIFQAEKIDAALATYFNTRPVAVGAAQGAVVEALPTVTKCHQCRCSVVVKQRPNNAGWYLGCLGFPDCRVSLWFPADVTEVSVHDTTCPNVSQQVSTY